MIYVYLLKSINFPNQTYVGYKTNLKQRIADHNYEESPHIAKYRPWRIEAYIAFREESKAMAFEKYLKSGSGRSFAKKRF